MRPVPVGEVRVALLPEEGLPAKSARVQGAFLASLAHLTFPNQHGNLYSSRASLQLPRASKHSLIR